MSFSYSPKVTTNGLILYLDAANTKSYSGSGVNWNDLTVNQNISTLTNGPTFSSSNMGIFSFDGTNDYSEITNKTSLLEFQPTQPYSVFVWFRGPSAQTTALVSNMDNSGTVFPGWDLMFNHVGSPNTIAMHLISTWQLNAMKIRVTYDFTNNLNRWIYFGYTYDGSSPTTTGSAINSVNFYFNGDLYTTGKASEITNAFSGSSQTITYSTNQRFRVAGRWNTVLGGQSLLATVTMSNVQIYNRVLNSTEVLQNYNSLKGRFGL